MEMDVVRSANKKKLMLIKAFICETALVLPVLVKDSKNGRIMDNETGPTIYGPVCLRKQRRKRQKALLVELFFDYAKNTTLHGLRYITEPGLVIVEKIFWLLTFVTSVSLSFYFIYTVWLKWKTSPVIVSFNEQNVPVEKVPFPAVTICPGIKFTQKRFNFTDVSTKYKDVLNPTLNGSVSDYNDTETFEMFDAISLICDSYENIFPFYPERMANASTVNRILKMVIKIHFYINRCDQFVGDETDCKKSFSSVLTKDGVCFTFNGLAAEEILRTENVQDDYKYVFSEKPSSNWTMDTGYLNNNRYAYPYRGRDNGGVPDLTLELNVFNKKRDSTCNAASSGFKIYLHHPADYPQSSAYYFAALQDQVSSMSVRFTMITTSENLRDYPLDIRQCYFPEDKKLKYFREYTISNCRFECLINFTYKACGCVPFYMPHENSSEICNVNTSTYCVKSAEESLARLPLEEKDKECKCLPACNSVQYDADIHKTDYEYNNFMKPIYYILDNETQRLYEELKVGEQKVSRVEIYYSSPMYMSVRRSELFGLTEFLGNCGGLLGLFLGFSWISLIEIFYFVTFRVFDTIRADLKREKAEGLKNIAKEE